MTADERAVRLALEVAAAQVRITELEAENAEYVRAHELMVAQFKTMQREKEHGWREAERWEAKVERLEIEKHDLAERLAEQ